MFNKKSKEKRSDICPCCKGKGIEYKKVSKYQYYICQKCGTLFIDSNIINKMDNDTNFKLVGYNEKYWKEELQSSKERSYGSTLARMAEAIYYSRIQVKKFIDIGGGPGYFLDAVAKYLPNKKDIFYSVEKYPPLEEYRTKSENYILADYDTLPFKVDCGICIEVLEHLTPKMFENILKQVASISNEQALYIFNTGMPEFVMNEDEKYLDPIKRGHIISWSLDGVRAIAKKMNFTVMPIKGKTWAFVLEYKSKLIENNMQDRIWTALPENLQILNDNEMGSVLKILGLETSRAY